MGSFFSDNDDLRFYFEHGVDWDQLVEITEYGFSAPDGFGDVAEAKQFYRQVAEMVGELCADEIAPRAAEIDRDPPRLVAGEVADGAAWRAIISTPMK
jgi:hypothetical protein